MQISPIRFNNINFTSTNRTIYRSKEKGEYASKAYDPYYSSMKGIETPKIVYSNSTYFLRMDFPWSAFPKYIQEKYPEGKVKIYNFACSDGSEPYSLALSLIEKLGEKEASRFFPIKASDADPEIIKQAKKGKINISLGEMDKIKLLINPPHKVEDYFKVEKIKTDKCTSYRLTPKEILSKNIIFECKGIDEGLDEIKKSNSIVLARNFWRYLSSEEIEKISMKLRKNLDSSSIIAIGDFDRIGSKLPFFLSDLGIQPIERYDMFENLLRITPFHDSPFLHDETLWHKKVQKEYLDYKLPYGVHQ